MNNYDIHFKMTTKENDISYEEYTAKEIEYLDKYGAQCNNILDDEELYEIITKHNFNDEKIKEEVKATTDRLKAKGDDYLWGNVENGKKKIKKEEEVKNKNKKTDKSGHVNKQKRTQYKKTNRIYDDSTKQPTKEQAAPVQDNQDDYQKYYTYKTGSYYNNYNQYHKKQNQQYTKKPYTKTNRNYTKPSGDDDLIIEYDENGKLITRTKNAPKQEVAAPEENKHYNESPVVINEIAESTKGKHHSPEKEKEKKSPAKHNQKSHKKEKEHHQTHTTHHKEATPVKKEPELVIESKQQTKVNDYTFSSVDKFEIQPTSTKSGAETVSEKPSQSTEAPKTQPPMFPHPGQFYGFPQTPYEMPTHPDGQNNPQQNPMYFFPMFPMPYYYGNPDDKSKSTMPPTMPPMMPNMQNMPNMQMQMMYQQMMYKQMMDMHKYAQEDPNHQFGGKK